MGDLGEIDDRLAACHNRVNLVQEFGDAGHKVRVASRTLGLDTRLAIGGSATSAGPPCGHEQGMAQPARSAFGDPRGDLDWLGVSKSRVYARKKGRSRIARLRVPLLPDLSSDNVGELCFGDRSHLLGVAIDDGHRYGIDRELVREAGEALCVHHVRSHVGRVDPRHFMCQANCPGTVRSGWGDKHLKVHWCAQ